MRRAAEWPCGRPPSGTAARHRRRGAQHRHAPGGTARRDRASDAAGARADRRARQRPGRAVAADAAPPGDRTAVLGPASRRVRRRGGPDLGHPGHDAPAVRAAPAGLAARRDGGPDGRSQGGRAAARRADQRHDRLPRSGLGGAAGAPQAVRRHRRRQPHRGDETRSARVRPGRRGARPARGADRVPRRHAVERRGRPPGGDGGRPGAVGRPRAGHRHRQEPAPAATPASRATTTEEQACR